MKEFFIGCLGAILLVVVYAIFEGWIFMLLWNWLVPMFWTTAPILSIWESVGILFLINLISKIFFSNKTN